MVWIVVQTVAHGARFMSYGWGVMKRNCNKCSFEHGSMMCEACIRVMEKSERLTYPGWTPEGSLSIFRERERDVVRK